jgi:hypothetical protein
MIDTKTFKTYGGHVSELSESFSVELIESTKSRVCYKIDDNLVRIESDDVALKASGDAQIALGLLNSLASGRKLSVDLPVSETLASNISNLQLVFSTWLKLSPVSVLSASQVHKDKASGVGCFFSGGVDSFYSALSNIDEIDFLVLVRGFDISLREVDDTLWDLALANARQSAKELKKTLIVVRTDIRAQRDSVGWLMSHGAAMAAIAHSLSNLIGRMYVPATYTYNDAIPLGSHPLTDRMWSGDLVELIHDGAHANRYEKISRIAREEVVASHLRVCWENRLGKFNCSQCPKCILTMTALRIVGELQNYSTFDKLSLTRLPFVTLSTQAQEVFTKQNLKVLGKEDKVLAWAIWSQLILSRIVRIDKVKRIQRLFSPEIKAKITRFGP